MYKFVEMEKDFKINVMIIIPMMVMDAHQLVKLKKDGLVQEDQVLEGIIAVN